jgi:hypothetical protein
MIAPFGPEPAIVSKLSDTKSFCLLHPSASDHDDGGRWRVLCAMKICAKIFSEYLRNSSSLSATEHSVRLVLPFSSSASSQARNSTCAANQKGKKVNMFHAHTHTHRKREETEKENECIRERCRHADGPGGVPRAPPGSSAPSAA